MKRLSLHIEGFVRGFLQKCRVNVSKLCSSLQSGRFVQDLLHTALPKQLRNPSPNANAAASNTCKILRLPPKVTAPQLDMSCRCLADLRCTTFSTHCYFTQIPSNHNSFSEICHEDTDSRQALQEQIPKAQKHSSKDNLRTPIQMTILHALLTS